MLWCCNASCWYIELVVSRLSTNVVGKSLLGLELGEGAAELEGAAVDEGTSDDMADDTGGATILSTTATGG